MRATNALPPFSENHELNSELKVASDVQALLGYPQILLQNKRELYSFLLEDLHTPTLEKLSPYLWWMSTQSSAHIAPLHHQAVKFRQVVLTENPELHLIWYYDKIFIKPILKYLLSHTFWRDYIMCVDRSGNDHRLPGIDDSLIQKSALGFLRTYRYLIKYESDFDIAKEKRLIPAATTWEMFSGFASELKAIQDTHVTGRYSYGQIRLSRLNFYIKFLLGRSTFHKVHGQYQAYFSRFYGPLFFVFGVLSVLLTATQLEIAVEPLVKNTWPSFWVLSRWTSVILAAFVFILSLILLLVLINKIAKEWYFAFRDRRRKRRGGFLKAKHIV